MQPTYNLKIIFFTLTYSLIVIFFFFIAGMELQDFTLQPRHLGSFKLNSILWSIDKAHCEKVIVLWFEFEGVFFFDSFFLLLYCRNGILCYIWTWGYYTATKMSKSFKVNSNLWSIDEAHCAIDIVLWLEFEGVYFVHFTLLIVIFFFFIAGMEYHATTEL